MLGLLLALTCPAVASAERLAVLDFKAKGGIDQSQLDVLGDMLANEIRRITDHEVITKADVQALLGLEKSKEYSGCEEESCLSKLGNALGVELLVTGNVALFGELFAVNLKLIDVKAVKVRSSVFRKVRGGEQGLLEDLFHAVCELMGVVGAVPPPTHAPVGSGAARGTTPYETRLQALASLGFDERLTARIADTGTALPSHTRETVWCLQRRGFSPDEIAALILEHELLELESSRHAELFAVYTLVGLPKKGFPRFAGSRRQDLTALYNKQTESTLLEVSKWVLLGLGLVMVAPGTLMATVDDTSSEDVGIAFLGVGSGLFGTSIILIAVDAADIGYLPRGFLETASRREIEDAIGDRTRRMPVARGGASSATLRVSAAPWVGDRGRAGVMLGFGF